MDKLLPAVLGLVRQGMGGVGAYVIAKGFADAALWQSVIGLALALVSYGWGYFAKTNTPDALLSLVRTTLSVATGYLVFRGWVSADLASQVVVALMGIIPTLWTVTANAKQASP